MRCLLGGLAARAVLLAAFATVAALAAPCAAAESLSYRTPWGRAPDLRAGTRIVGQSGSMLPPQMEPPTSPARVWEPMLLLTGTATVRGHVYSLAGQPLVGARVGWEVDASTTSRGSKATNESGGYSFSSVPASSGNGTVWCTAPDGSFELVRTGLTWANDSNTTFDFAPAPLPTSFVRGGPAPTWRSAWVSLSGSDGSPLFVNAKAKGVWDGLYEEWKSPNVADVATLPGVYDTAAVNFWANEGLEVSFNARTGPGSRRVVGPVATMRSLSFPDHQHGWVVGSGGLAATDDGGLTWTVQYQGMATLTGVCFADALHGVAVGAIYRAGRPDAAFAMWTSDGGASWTPGTGLDSTQSFQILRDIEFVDATHAWAVGDSGLIFATNDGGATWAAETSGTTAELQSVTFADPEHGWAVGRSQIILATTDGGATWVVQHQATSDYFEWLNGVDAVDASHAWTVGNDGIALRTTDGGATWDAMHPTSGTGSADEYGQVEFVDTQHGWLAGPGPGVMVTSDGGLTWTTQLSEYASVTSLDMDGPMSGWVLRGSHNDLVDSIDGGAQWGPRSLTADEADSLRVFTTKPWSASGAPGMPVVIDLQSFPMGWLSAVYGYSAYPSSAPVKSFGTHQSLGAADETSTLRVPKTATPGYCYWFGFQHQDGPLSLEVPVQVCRFKSSASRVAPGGTVTLSGIVPTKGHWGRTAGKLKTVYLFKRFNQRSQPTTGDPTKQGWRYVGKYRTNGHGAFSAKGVKIGRAAWFVVMYPGDSWYWAGYTGVVKVGLR